MKLTIRIIRPSSREEKDLLPQRLAEMKQAGVEVLFDELPQDPAWPFAAAPTELRAKALANALLEYESSVVFCARGGYGASELLPLLPWKNIAARPAKWLVGFSDISALHSALFTKCKWPGLHGPMPATSLWRKDGNTSDVDLLWDIVAGKAKSGAISLKEVSTGKSKANSQEITGWLFGGNLSVLSNLIGTPYFPSSLAGAIVFLEDLTEPPGRLVRQFTQWLLSGRLEGVKALVLGSFHTLGKDIPDNDPRLICAIAERAKIPTFKSADFGHISPNYPLVIGSQATIGGSKLSWQLGTEKIS